MGSRVVSFSLQKTMQMPLAPQEASGVWQAMLTG